MAHKIKEIPIDDCYPDPTEREKINELVRAVNILIKGTGYLPDSIWDSEGVINA